MIDYQNLICKIFAFANKLGATYSEVVISEGSGFDVSVRVGEIENLVRSVDAACSLTVYFGKKSGSAISSDLSDKSIFKMVERACYIAKLAEEDEYCVFPDLSLIAYEYKDFDLYHPWDISIDEAVLKAKELERIGLSYDKKITNSNGSSFYSTDVIVYYAATNGFLGIDKCSSHGFSLSLIAEKNNEKQVGSEYSAAIMNNSLLDFESVAVSAAKKSIEKLGSKRIKSHKNINIIFKNDVAKSLIKILFSLISGNALYRKSSFLVDSLGSMVFPEFINVLEDPHIYRDASSSSYDAEGVKTYKKYFVKDGVIENYLLNTYSANRLNMKTTGNAGGLSSVFVNSSNLSFDELLKVGGEGLVVTSLIGSGVNGATGDYSNGASGFWFSDGEIKFPVNEITISSNLRDMFKNIIAISDDIEYRGSIYVGSILVGGMTISGE